ncbi:MAG: hypothetical protein ABR576_06955 [Thermoanaerobaculia bacterium]
METGCADRGAIFLVAAGSASAAERYLGQIVNLNARAGQATDFFTLHVDAYSSDKEIAGLLQALKNKRARGLQEALWEIKGKGWFRIGTNLGYHAAVIRSHTTPTGGKVIRVLTDRPIMFYELRNNTRSRNNPFGFIEISVSPDGQGEGRMIAAASSRITNGEVELENYDVQPLRILNVRREM